MARLSCGWLHTDIVYPPEYGNPSRH